MATQAEELFDNAIKLMEKADTAYNSDYSRRLVRESRQWLALAQHALAVEAMELAKQFQ